MSIPNVRTLSAIVALAVGVAGLASCEDESSGPEFTPIVVDAKSPTPNFIKNVMAGVSAFTLISSDDVLPNSPSFVFGGSADGNGLLKNVDGTYTLLVNNEDNFSVSRLKLDASFKPISGDYLLNSTGGQWRLCSATLATVEEHGFGPIYLTNGETSIESMVHAVDPFGAPNTSKLLPALGHWSSEQSLPLPKTAYPGKTVIMIGDDDSNPGGGQVAMYVSGTVGDLDNGNLYVLTRNDMNQREKDMVVGQTYPVTFKQILNQKTLTGAQTDAAAVAAGAIKFGRVEDVDYRRGTNAGREIYFNVTGQATTGANADFSRTKYGRVYRLMLDVADPLKGTLEVILDGDDKSGPAKEFQNVDNVMATKNYVYVSEDPNAYGDETHDARIYQYNIATKALAVVMELDHHRGDTKYNGPTGQSAFGAWEFGGFTDVSDIVHRNDTFILSLQPHTWTGDRYKGVDGGSVRPAENQASSMLLVTGLPR